MDNTWADLSDAQREALKAGLNGQSIYGLFWNDETVVQYHALQEAGLVRSGRITDLGRAVRWMI